MFKKKHEEAGDIIPDRDLDERGNKKAKWTRFRRRGGSRLSLGVPLLTLLLLANLALNTPTLAYDLPIVFETPSDAGPDSPPIESMLLVPVDPLNPAPAAAQLTTFLQETQTYAHSVSLISDSANARNQARKDACHGSLIWENVPIAATNSLAAARASRSHRSRRGDSALTLRQINKFDDFFLLGKDMNLNGVWAEIGVCQGDTSKKILEKGPQTVLLMVDAWDAVDVYTKEEGEKNFEITLKNVQNSKPEKYRTLRMMTAEAAKEVADGSLDLIYLDAGHMYGDAKSDIEAWWPKLKSGGLFTGDDYYNGYVPLAGYTFGVKDAGTNDS